MKRRDQDNDVNDPNRFDEMLGAALREQNALAQCPPPDMLLELIERGGEHPDSERLLLHIAECGECLRDYGELRQTVQVSEQTTNAVAPPPPNPRILGW